MYIFFVLYFTLLCMLMCYIHYNNHHHIQINILCGCCLVEKQKKAEKNKKKIAKA